MCESGLTTSLALGHGCFCFRRVPTHQIPATAPRALRGTLVRLDVLSRVGPKVAEVEQLARGLLVGRALEDACGDGAGRAEEGAEHEGFVLGAGGLGGGVGGAIGGRGDVFHSDGVDLGLTTCLVRSDIVLGLIISLALGHIRFVSSNSSPAPLYNRSQVNTTPPLPSSQHTPPPAYTLHNLKLPLGPFERCEMTLTSDW